MATSLGLQVILAPAVIPAFSAPPTVPIQVSVYNPASTPVTLVNWGTPLDPRAGILGIFDVRDTSNDEQVTIDTIKISRQLPPSAEDLVEIPAGSSVDAVVNLPHVPLVEGREYSIQARGVWHAVWESPRVGVSVAQLNEFEGSQRGEFESNVASIKGE